MLSNESKIFSLFQGSIYQQCSEWELIFGCAVKAISSPGVRSPWIHTCTLLGLHPIFFYHQEVFEVPNPALSSHEATVCGLAKIFIFKITSMFVETVIFYPVQNQRFLCMPIFGTNKQKIVF